MKRKAKHLINQKEILDDGAIIEAHLWELPKPVLGSRHPYKYRLYFGKEGRIVVLYDNERGKGDHRHIGGHEEPYDFIDENKLMADFVRDVLKYG